MPARPTAGAVEPAKAPRTGQCQRRGLDRGRGVAATRPASPPDGDKAGRPVMPDRRAGGHGRRRWASAELRAGCRAVVAGAGAGATVAGPWLLCAAEPWNHDPALDRLGTIVVGGIGPGRRLAGPRRPAARACRSRPTVAAARTEAATTMDAILEASTAAGVARRDVRTAMLVGPAPLRATATAGPRHDRVRAGQRRAGDGPRPRRPGRRHRWRPGRRAPRASTTCVPAGRPGAAEKEARVRAMAAARGRADVLADAAGLAIDGVSSSSKAMCPRRRCPSEGRADG